MAQDSPLEFPCEFPVKAMGPATREFESLVLGIVRRHVPDLGEGAVRSRISAQGKYLSITVTFRATSREQLDRLYEELNAQEQVLMTL